MVSTIYNISTFPRGHKTIPRKRTRTHARTHKQTHIDKACQNQRIRKTQELEKGEDKGKIKNQGNKKEKLIQKGKIE